MQFKRKCSTYKDIVLLVLTTSTEVKGGIIEYCPRAGYIFHFPGQPATYSSSIWYWINLLGRSLNSVTNNGATDNGVVVFWILSGWFIKKYGKPQKSSFFSGPATKRGGGKGCATKEIFFLFLCSRWKIKYILFKTTYPNIDISV